MSEWAPKRFWTEVSVANEADGFVIQLDGRPVRTPAKRSLRVPTEAMAGRIADEWDAQTEKVDPQTMPWTRSANSAIDNVAQQRDAVTGFLADYADTDLLLYRAEGPEGLVLRQRQGWDPILDWIAGTYGVRLAMAEGIMPVSQDPGALQTLAAAMDDMSAFQITGFHDLVTLTGSFSLGLAVVGRQADLAEIWALSRIDEDWQIEQWGQDEEASEVAALKKKAFLHAADFFHTA